MTSEIKKAIQSAEKRLDNEVNEKLTNEIHDYLREELNSIESLKKQKQETENKIRIHEENIKNVKTGNLEAIERRRQALNAPRIWTFTTNAGSGTYFYNRHVAGFTYESPLTGITYTF